MNGKVCDLHVHTYYSDSTFSPKEVIDTAKHAGLNAIAICDHDCVDGIPQCTKYANPAGIEIIPGIELTIEKNDEEIHILGYFIDWKARWLKSKLKEFQKSRIDRIYKMVDLLKKQGVDVDPREVFKLSGRGSVGRLHVAMVMLKGKKISHIQEAFNKYIGQSKPCYVKHLRFTPKEAIEMVIKAGGVPVLAHPSIMGKDEYITEFIEYGLRGIEVYHTDHNLGDENKYLNIAKKNNLIITGGSDCHGLGKGRILIGKVKVPYSFLERLKEEADKIKMKNKKL